MGVLYDGRAGEDRGAIGQREVGDQRTVARQVRVSRGGASTDTCETTNAKQEEVPREIVRESEDKLGRLPRSSGLRPCIRRGAATPTPRLSHHVRSSDVCKNTSQTSAGKKKNSHDKNDGSPGKRCVTILRSRERTNRGLSTSSAIIPTPTAHIPQALRHLNIRHFPR